MKNTSGIFLSKAIIFSIIRFLPRVLKFLMNLTRRERWNILILDDIFSNQTLCRREFFGSTKFQSKENELWSMKEYYIFFIY